MKKTQVGKKVKANMVVGEILAGRRIELANGAARKVEKAFSKLAKLAKHTYTPDEMTCIEVVVKKEKLRITSLGGASAKTIVVVKVGKIPLQYLLEEMVEQAVNNGYSTLSDISNVKTDVHIGYQFKLS